MTTTQKSPAEIADTFGPEGMHNLIEASRVRAYMVAAIEADRAQRAATKGNQMRFTSHTNRALEEIRATLADAVASSDEPDYDLTDHLDAWEGSLREPYALGVYTQDEINFALKVITRLANVRERSPRLTEEYYAAESHARDLIVSADIGVDFGNDDSLAVITTVGELLDLVTRAVLDSPYAAR